MVLTKEIQRQQEKAEENKNRGRAGTGGGAGPTHNSLAGQQGETVEYVNESAT
jgi:hypothetical protein